MWSLIFVRNLSIMRWQCNVKTQYILPNIVASYEWYYEQMF